MSFERSRGRTHDPSQFPTQSVIESSGRGGSSTFSHDCYAYSNEIAMRIELNQSGLCLERNKVVKLRGAIGYTVVCHSGSVWVTQDGDTRDVILRAGETFTFDRDGPALLQAFEPGAINIVQTEGQTRTAGLTAFLKSLLLGARLARSAIGV